MCRLTALISNGKPILLADIITRPRMSIIRQSFACQERLRNSDPRWAYEQSSLNGDGFGVGWYAMPCYSNMVEDPSSPCIFNSLKPAWSDKNLQQIADKTLSQLIFAHVRAAGPGSGVATEESCHPFSYGRIMFMHNGHIADFRRILKPLLALLEPWAFDYLLRHSVIDSYVLFAIFLSCLKTPNERHTADELRTAVDETLRLVQGVLSDEQVHEVSLLNMVICDGSHIVASRCAAVGRGESPSDDENQVFDNRPASLYFATGTKWERHCDRCDDFKMVHNDKRNEVAIISSEPLTDVLEEWVSVPPNSIIIVTSQVDVMIHRVGETGRGPLALQWQNTMREATSDRGSYSSATQVDCRHVISLHERPVLAFDTLSVRGVNDRVELLFSGSQDCSVRIWDFKNLSLLATLLGHRGSVLSVLALDMTAPRWTTPPSTPFGGDPSDLRYSTSLRRSSTTELLKVDDVSGQFLITGGSDATVFIWDITEMSQSALWGSPISDLRPSLKIRFKPNPGDVLSLALGADNMLHLGFQNTKIMTIEIEELLAQCSDECKEITFVWKDAITGASIMCFEDVSNPMTLQHVTASLLPSPPVIGHHGGVEALHAVKGYLFSGGGDGIIICWSDNTKMGIMTAHQSAVMCLASSLDDLELYSGSRDRCIRIWDIQTLSCKQTLRGHTSDVLCLKVCQKYIVSGSGNGEILVWCKDTHVVLFKLNDPNIISPGSFTALHTYTDNQDVSIFAGCGDCHGRLWKIPAADTTKHQLSQPTVTDVEEFFGSLISLRSVSGDRTLLGECWKTARFVGATLEKLGAMVRLVDVGQSCAPLVFGRLGDDPKKPTVAFYSHYDVVPADDQDSMSWSSDPWRLTGRNGFYYGRGVTDNKGPIVAQIFAVDGLRKKCQAELPVNVIWLSEGNEEQGSYGFENVVRDNAKLLESVACIICTNSFWPDDDTPCLTTGMRGVVDMEIHITCGENPTGYHSGIHGGAISEPLFDLIGVTSNLVDPSGLVLVPDFYSDVIPSDADGYDLDLDRYILEVSKAGLRSRKPRDILESRWLLPSLSITDIRSSSPNDKHASRIIPASCSCTISIRTVPNQNPDTLITLIKNHIRHEFSKRRSPNVLEVRVLTKHHSWKGDVDTYTTIARKVLSSVWGCEIPLVREGGTIPVLHFLQSTFGVPVLQIPLGQASDSAHLPDERLRTLNLFKGIDVLEGVLMKIGELPIG